MFYYRKKNSIDDDDDVIMSALPLFCQTGVVLGLAAGGDPSQAAGVAASSQADKQTHK